MNLSATVTIDLVKKSGKHEMKERYSLNKQLVRRIYELS